MSIPAGSETKVIKASGDDDPLTERESPGSVTSILTGIDNMQLIKKKKDRRSEKRVCEGIGKFVKQL
jgi:hypothetical protein